MLLTEVTTEARALLHLAEDLGEDPESVVAQWAEATLAEAKAVVREAYRLRPEVKGSEWYADFLSAHRWNRQHGLTTTSAVADSLATDGSAYWRS